MTIRKILIYIGVILLIVFGILYFHQKKEINGNYYTIHQNEASYNSYKKDADNCTQRNFQKQFDRTEPNLGNALRYNNRRLYKGLYLAYDHCHTSSQLVANRPKILGLLGQKLGYRVLQIVKPQYNDSPFNKNGVAKSISNKAIQYHIGYGQYNESDNTIPMEIHVEYKTPKATPQNKIPHIKQQLVFDGNTSISANLDVQQMSINPTHAYNKI